MRFHRVKEVLDWATALHAGLAARYRTLAHGMAEERLRMALLYLAEHEHEMQAALARYLANYDAHRNVLDTWFSDTAEFPRAEEIEQGIQVGPGTTTADLLDAALNIHHALEDLYRTRRDTAPIDDERELFAALVSLHETESHRLARDMARLEAL